METNGTTGVERRPLLEPVRNGRPAVSAAGLRVANPDGNLEVEVEAEAKTEAEAEAGYGVAAASAGAGAAGRYADALTVTSTSTEDPGFDYEAIDAGIPPEDQ